MAHSVYKNIEFIEKGESTILLTEYTSVLNYKLFILSVFKAASFPVFVVWGRTVWVEGFGKGIWVFLWLF